MRIIARRAFSPCSGCMAMALAVRSPFTVTGSLGIFTRFPFTLIFIRHLKEYSVVLLNYFTVSVNLLSIGKGILLDSNYMKKSKAAAGVFRSLCGCLYISIENDRRYKQSSQDIWYTPLLGKR